MVRVGEVPIQRLRQRFDRLDGRLVGLVSGTGAVVTLGFIELLRSPLEQLSRVTIELLAVRALLFMAPLLVSLLLLLRDGPLLLSGHRSAGPWAADLLASGLLSMVLLLYFLLAVLVTASLALNQGEVVQEVAFLIGQLEPSRFAAALIKSGAYGAIAAGLCLRQRRPAASADGASPATASRMARSILLGVGVLVCLDLVWTIAIDPLRMGEAGL